MSGKTFYTPHHKFVKVICLILVITMISEICLPTMALAMTTNGASQPEVFSYQPVDATDNVSLTTGAFNYTIPITSIPEYPMAISYRSSNKPDEEAGMFGFGFHGFSGAIGRNMLGLPDDIRGATRNYHYQNQNRWSASAGATIAVGIGGEKIPALEALEISASVTITGGYDNYTGAFGSIGFGLGAGTSLLDTKNLSVNAGLGLSLMSDSRNSRATLGAGAGISVGPNINSNKYWAEALNHQNANLVGCGFSQQIGDKSSSMTAASTVMSAGISNFSTSAGGSVQSLAPLSNVLPVNKGWGLSISLPIPIGGGAVKLSVNGSYNQSKQDRNNINKKVFGYQYLGDVDRKDKKHLGDFTIEGENVFPEDDFIKEKGYDPRLNPSYLQRDYFVANAMGLGGSMQLNQEEYGVVSRGITRNQYRDIGLLSVKTSRNESFPWTSVDEAKFNEAVDILKLLKGGKSENDFDNVMFKHSKKASLVTDKHTFGKTKFKMRGELSGEFDLASENYSDNEPNVFDLVKIQGSGGNVSGFLRGGRKVPLFEPKTSAKTQRLFDGAGSIESSTQISYKTLGQTIEAYDALLDNDPNMKSDRINYKFSQSFYTHNSYQKSNAAKNQNVVLNDHLTEFNILKHLKEVKDNSESDISSVISSIEVKNVSGLKYIFNLPAFAKETESVMLQGKGIKPPVIRGDTYKSFGNKNRNKVSIKDKYAYPYAWMLTAIVGEDYVDFDDVPGPSDGDLGYWVKFRYTKTSDNYRWRFPFTGMMYMSNSISIYGDDMYNMTTGLKEIYVISEIESSHYVSKYNYQKRFDGVDAAGKVNGNAHNPLAEGDLTSEELFSEKYIGDNFQFAVTSIDLFKKHAEGENSKQESNLDSPGKIVKSTKFEYDYSTSSEVPNNISNYSGLNVHQSDVSYYYNPQQGKDIGTGRLTLRKIQHVAYDHDGVSSVLPSYNFNYNSEEYNPSYNDRQRDMWGNYNKNASTVVDIPGQSKNVKLYHPYCEYDPSIANENAKVWQLNSIELPSGGEMNIDYQAQSYAFVQDKKACVMRKLEENSGKVFFKAGEYTRVSIDVDDICKDEIRMYGEEADLKGLSQVMEPGEMLYGEISFFQSSISPDPGKQYVASTEVELVEILNDIHVGNDGRYYQSISVKANHKKENKGNWDKPPFFREVELYMYNNSEQITCIRQTMPMSCSKVAYALEKMDKMSKDKPLVAAKKAVTNFRNIFKPDGKFKGEIIRCYGEPGAAYIADLSFIRTPVYKAKYTGTRVKQLRYYDNFQYASSQLENEKGNSYGSAYFYDENSDGTGESAGVATIEPLGGKAMAINTNELVGMGYLPSPAIISGKTTLAGMYKKLEAEEGEVKSRDKGKTVYEYYTPKDKSLNYLATDAIKSEVYNGVPKNLQGYFVQNGMLIFFIIKVKIFGKKIKIKIPMILPISIRWRRKHHYKMKSYAYTDYTDIYGRPKSIVQLNSGGTTEGKQEFKYYGVGEGVPVYKEGFHNNNPKMMRPGKVDQAWSEAWYSKETDLSLIPWILHFNAKTERYHNYINMKYSYIPPVMKEVITSVDGQKTITKNTGFDYYTGTPIEVSSTDSYGNTKIKRTVPAYWKYGQMGPVDKNPNNLNKLTAKTASYLYLNKTDNDHLLGASVTRWDKSDWNIIDYLQPEREIIDGDSYKYVYHHINGAEIKGAYSVVGKNNDEHITRNTALFKPVETYTYEVGLKQDGTFDSFTDFNHNSSQNDKWKMVSKSELFDANGVLVQASDILGKYVSQHMGYNFSKAISVVANASYYSSFYDGAENTYSVDNSEVLESNKINIGQAKVYRGSRGGDLADYNLNSYVYLTGSNASEVRLISVKKPAELVSDKVFARLAVKYNNGLSRILFMSMDEQHRYQLISNYSEDFSGFISLPGNDLNTDYLLLDWKEIVDLQIMPLDDTNGYMVNSVVRDMQGPFANCKDFPQKQYQLPEADHLGEVHTGNYGFVLNGGDAEGTIIRLEKSKMGEVEYNRKYKAMVWVHNSSPTGTEFVVRYTNVNDEVTEEVITPEHAYGQSGNWILLRQDFETQDVNGVDTKEVDVLMRNRSGVGMALYDDIRVLPYHAEMSNYVFDHRFDRVTSTIDADNFATYIEYDERGRVVQSAVEINGLGKKVIKQSLYNDQKK